MRKWAEVRVSRESPARRVDLRNIIGYGWMGMWLLVEMGAQLHTIGSWNLYIYMYVEQEQEQELE